MVHISDVISEPLSLIVEALSEIYSTPFGSFAFSITILIAAIGFFQNVMNCINSSFGALEVSEPETEVEEFSEPEPEVKEVPKPQIKKIVVKPVIKKPQLVVCDYCGTKHKAEDKICKTCNAVLPTEKE